MNKLEECILKLNQSILALHDRLSAVEKVCGEVIKRNKSLQDKFATEKPNYKFETEVVEKLEKEQTINFIVDENK